MEGESAAAAGGAFAVTMGLVEVVKTLVRQRSGSGRNTEQTSTMREIVLVLRNVAELQKDTAVLCRDIREHQKIQTARGSA